MSVTQTETAAPTTPARILVADDLMENRELLQAHLESAGYQVLAAVDGLETLTAVAAHPPDLILLDLLMPGVDGFEVCRRLKADAATAFIPIIVLTALHDFEHRIRGIDVGADDFLTKPFNHVELLTRVRSLLRMKSLHDQVAAYGRRLEEKVAERTAELERALVDLRELDRFKSRFLSNLSHELRTPLTPVKGYLELLLDEAFGPLTRKQREALEQIATSADRLTHLIDDLLTYVQWEVGQAGLRREPVAMVAAIGAVETKVAAAAREKGVQVTIEVPAELPRVLADPEELGRALGHLLENAVKFTPQGGRVRVTARRTHGSSEFEDAGRYSAGQPAPKAPPGSTMFVEVTIQDTGVGIPSEALPRIFDRFYQADSSATRAHGGTGLGLAIVKRILDAHGASIAVESQQGAGTTFALRFPGVP